MTTSLSLVQEIMDKFTYETGVFLEKKPRRYLWTDAFAVCNFLELLYQTGDEKYKNLALCLVDQVHHVLGKHREDNSRKGWISGLSEQEGEKHPTIGGLRIGKELWEREPGEPLDMNLEWDRDGQYYHYLTKWMHALNKVSRVTKDLTCNLWAIELAKTTHAAFTYLPPYKGQKRMYWKMSIDLSRPLVPSMGQHDPLDGLITYNELQATARQDPNIKAEIADIAHICEGKDWTTGDPLGVGELLCSAYKVAQLVTAGYFKQKGLIPNLLKTSLVGIKSYLKENPLKLPAQYRLAFREFGFSIGLKAIEKLQVLTTEEPNLFKEEHFPYSQIDSLLKYKSLTDEIEAFWIEQKSKESESWKEHYDINMVMLATSLAPNEYLTI